MSLLDYFPRGSVLSAKKADHWLSQARGSIRYTSDQRSLNFTLLPFQFFGLRYEEDIVIETTHPDWSMHEYARVKAGGQEVWIAKDSDSAGIQTVTSGLKNLDKWVPEAPVPRHASPVEVEDRSTPGFLDVSIHYKTPKEQRVDLEFSCPRPGAYQAKRNGSTFNHSEKSIAAVLNISHQQMSNVKAKISFDGKPYAIRKVLGLVPVKALLHQSQGGVAAASMKVTSVTSGGFRVLRPIPGTQWNTQSDEIWNWTGDASYSGKVEYSDLVSEWVYSFNKGEFQSVEVNLPGTGDTILKLNLSAPLPDLARSFEGEVVRHFTMEIEGELHGYGQIRARSLSDGSILEFLPRAPYWFSSRPMQTTVKILSLNEAEIRTSRIK